MWFYQAATVSNQSAYLNYLINLWKSLIYNKNLIGWRQEIEQCVVAAKGLIDRRRLRVPSGQESYKCVEPTAEFRLHITKHNNTDANWSWKHFQGSECSGDALGLHFWASLFQLEVIVK
jgi:hypothetical protein